jgi:hypothetical protein
MKWPWSKSPVSDAIPLPAATIPALTDPERREVASRWGQIACIFCGAWHPGLCNRVRRVELDERGQPRKTVFWDKWDQNPRSIWPEDVWGTKSEMIQEFETQARDNAEKLEIQRTAAREAERVRREQQRTEGPVEKAARALAQRGTQQ